MEKLARYRFRWFLFFFFCAVLKFCGSSKLQLRICCCKARARVGIFLGLSVKSQTRNSKVSEKFLDVFLGQFSPQRSWGLMCVWSGKYPAKRIQRAIALVVELLLTHYTCAAAILLDYSLVIELLELVPPGKSGSGKPSWNRNRALDTERGGREKLKSCSAISNSFPLPLDVEQTFPIVQ